jgi:Fe-S cluster assembly iron-binding protein IscA
MFSPPLYQIRKFPIRLILESNLNLQCDDGKYKIRQADNMLFRQVRLITGDLSEFNKYVVFIDCNGYRKKRDDLENIIRNGFKINDQKFVLSERSASMCRNAQLGFVDESISEQLDRIISMDLDMKKTCISKFVAYRGLMFSSCFCMENWFPKVIVVDDFTVTVPNQHIRYLADDEVEYIDKATGENKKWKQKKVTDGYKDIVIQPWDGCGLIHPELALEIKNLIGIDKENPTSIMLRAPFIKGVVHAVDYESFWLEHGVNTVVDLWGIPHSIHDRMIILTKSMYKGYKYFQKEKNINDWHTFWSQFQKYNHCWGVAKWNYSVENEPRFTRQNYQVLQTLNLPYDEFQELANDSIDWLDKIINGDIIYTYAFLGLFADNLEPQNAYMKALLKNNETLYDPQIKKYLGKMLKKYIDEMKCGKIWLKSAFKIITSDLIMLMEFIAGLPPTGFLAEDEMWSKSYEGTMIGEHTLNRNPHIAASESVILRGVEKNKWIQHLDNVVIVNARSIVCPKLSGCDTDGDLVLVCDHPLMLKGIDRDLVPVIDVDDKITVPDKEINIENIIDSVVLSLDNRIGEYSNTATCYLNKNPKTDENRQRYLDYVNYISVLNGKEIDKAKTGVQYNCPKYISKYAKPFPYFMKYAGKYYYDQGKFNHNNSNLNKLCRFIEKIEKQIKFKNKKDFDYSIYINPEIQRNSEKFEQIHQLFKEFSKEMQDIRKFEMMLRRYDQYSEYLSGISKEEAKNFIINYEYYYNLYRNKAKSICSNESELANYCVEICYSLYPNKEKTFAWTMAQGGILQNLKQTCVQLPIKDESGQFSYLGRNYSIVNYSGEETC